MTSARSGTGGGDLAGDPGLVNDLSGGNFVLIAEPNHAGRCAVPAGLATVVVRFALAAAGEVGQARTLAVGEPHVTSDADGQAQVQTTTLS